MRRFKPGFKGMALLIPFALAWGLALIFRAPVAGLLQKEALRDNYQGQEIPTAMGLVLLLAVLGGLLLLSCLGAVAAPLAKEQGIWLSLVCFAGVVDDAFGDGKDKGLRKHWRALRQGRLTTGMLKVIIVFGGALLSSLPLTSRSLLRFGILVLAVNLFNQLDLRPGRALKFFLLLAGGFLFRGNVLAALGSGAGLALLPGDLRSDYMLGDAGANLLGAMAGLVIMTLPYSWLPGALLLLAIGNGVGEFLSFSMVIEKNKILHWLDQFGRPQAGK